MHNMRLICIIIAFMLAMPAWAHDVWLVPGEKDAMRLVFGHPGELEPYDAGKVSSVVAVDKQGARQKPGSRVHDGHLMITTSRDTAVIAVNFDHGIWTEDADENLINKPRQDVPGYLSSVHETMHSKSLLAWSGAAGRPIGSIFEIVPLANPFTLKPGDELPVQVLYDGAPLAGAELEILGVFDLFFTDKEGKVSLPLPDEDFQYVLGYHRVKLGDGAGADESKLSANLTFTRK